MNILSVNKYFYPKGGAETYFFALNQALMDKGYSITPFSMKDEHNSQTPYQEYFVRNFDYYDKSLLKRLRYAAHIIYSVEARKKIGQLITASKPDLAHVHNFYHQLSPSIFNEMKRHHLPIVFTAHDLKLLCPDYQMLNRGEVCEECHGNKYYKCVLNRCMKNSLSASLISTAEMYLHSLLKSFEAIDIIITPSMFYKNKFIEYGFSPEKVLHIPNFIDTRANQPDYVSENYMAYIGRLSKEKGILTLIEAMKDIKGIDLYIVGDGPLRGEIEKIIAAQGLTHIKLLGFKTGKELKEIIQHCKFTVLPSEWYENSPLSVFESMAYGKPVIGANIGGIPELIDHERTGYIFESRNSQQLAERINELANHPGRAEEMGREARTRAETEYNHERHFEKVEKVYRSLVGKSIA